MPTLALRHAQDRASGPPLLYAELERSERTRIAHRLVLALIEFNQINGDVEFIELRTVRFFYNFIGDRSRRIGYAYVNAMYMNGSWEALPAPAGPPAAASAPPDGQNGGGLRLRAALLFLSRLHDGVLQENLDKDPPGHE